ncbi:MAG TPA: methanogen output domain 1-containing protein, partial [Methanothermobacter sp.]|nr:methanogen output domain 1-containing protein [Methanothermobacter sp.]
VTMPKLNFEHGKNYLYLGNCPWMSETSASPIFCLICRAIIIRSFTWTSLKGNVEQNKCILNGNKDCSFDFKLF